MQQIFLLLPDFALILLGVLIRKYMSLSEDFWQGAERLVYFVFFPALLFAAVLRTPIHFATAMPLIGTALAAMLVSGGVALLMRPLNRVSAQQFSSLFQCSFRFNSYIGLAVAGIFWGVKGVGLLGLILAVAVPLANIAAVWMLARHGELGIWREMCRNPLIVATLVGLIANMIGVELPKPVFMLLNRLGDTSITLGLIVVGAALKFEKLSAPELNFSMQILLLKLILMPVVAILVGNALGLTGGYFNIAVLFAALPTASSAYILATRMGGDGKIVAWQISVSTLCAMVSLPLWSMWLAHR